MANYQETLTSAYSMMDSAPMQMKRNASGGVDANVMGMDGYGDSNYGWNRIDTKGVDAGAAGVNKAAADTIKGSLGTQGNYRAPTATAYEGKAGDNNNWWSKAYGDVKSWAISPEQENPDRQAMQDAFQVSMAEKGYDWELTKAMSDVNVGHQRGIMQLSADLDRRNTTDIMGAEHGFKIAGMETSQRLQKDYLGAETQSEVRKTQETGLQQRLGLSEQGYQEREGMAEQGFQTRANTRTEGQENRLQRRTEGDEARRLMSHDRESAVRTAVGINRR